jgi:thiol-disulfide isomerase/thioredoxin
MKRVNYILAAGAMAIMASCGSKPGYVITGTVEGAQEGDTVLLMERAGREFNNLDTAIITNGQFEFKGTQDSTAYRYISWKSNDDRLIMDLFVENGQISVSLGKESDSATGTPSNDAYQQVRSELNKIESQERPLVDQYRNPETTEEDKTAIYAQLDELDKQSTAINKKGILDNINTLVGVTLFKKNYYGFETSTNDSIINLIPEQFQSDEDIVKIKETVAKQKATAPGAKFVDLEMLTPDGQPIKLSDYVGKGKLVLVDFWASWCGPCRREMPNIVEIYKDYKGDKFEIVGVSLDKDGAAWQEAIKTLGITWPQMSDLKFWQSAGADAYAVNSIPHTVLIDGEGTIIARGLHGEELRAKVDELMK